MKEEIIELKIKNSKLKNENEEVIKQSKENRDENTVCINILLRGQKELTEESDKYKEDKKIKLKLEDELIEVKKECDLWKEKFENLRNIIKDRDNKREFILEESKKRKEEFEIIQEAKPRKLDEECWNRINDQE